MARLDINSLTLWITAAAAQHPHDLADHVAQRIGVTRRTANKALQRMVELSWLAREGPAHRPSYRAGLLRQVVRSYELEGLEEDIPWSRDFAPYFVLKRWKGVGVAVPPTYLEPFAQRLPKVLRALAGVDRWLEDRPVARGMADHVLLEFERRD